MRYLGIDFGTKKIGIAISDENAGFAFPHSSLQNNTETTKRIGDIIKKEGVGALVVGESKTFGGENNEVMKDIVIFAEKLESETGIKVHFIREAFSSVEAARFAPKGDKHNDSSAAAIILQRFLDTLPQAQ